MKFQHDDLGTLHLFTVDAYRWRWLIFVWWLHIHVDHYSLADCLNKDGSDFFVEGELE